MIYLSTDISFTSMGITVLDTDAKEIDLKCIKGRMGKNFQNVFREAFSRCRDFSKLLNNRKIDVYISEEPFVGGITSPGLFALDSMIFYTIILKGVKAIYTSHPSHLQHLHGKKYSKGDSVKMAKELIVVYNMCGYKINKTSLNNDMAESLIYMTRLVVQSNIDSYLTSNIIKYNSRFGDKKENLLYEMRGYNGSQE